MALLLQDDHCRRRLLTVAEWLGTLDIKQCHAHLLQLENVQREQWIPVVYKTPGDLNFHDVLAKPWP